MPARRPPGPPPPRPISPPHGKRAHMALHAMSDSDNEDDEDDEDDPEDQDYEPQWDDPTWDIGVEDEKMDEEEPAQDDPPYNPEDDDPDDDPDDPPYNPDQTKENWAFIKAQKADSTVRKTDLDIMRFRQFLAAGNHPGAFETLSAGPEVEKIWSGGGFGNTDPDGLVSAMWFLLALNFGLRGCHECRQLTVGDLSVKQHVSGQSYLEMVERTTKTRCGAGRGHGSGQRAFTPKAWSNGTSRCPVYYYNEYMRRRPDKMTDPSSPFFLNVNRQKKADNPIWFACKPMGKNLLSGMLKRAANHVGIDRPGLTNHTV